MTKKNYIQPSTDVTNICFNSVLCVSDLTPSIKNGGEGDHEPF